MITVVISSQLRYGFVESPAFILCQLLDFWLEVFEHFIFCDATYRCIFWFKTDVTQIVEHREEWDLRKLSDACNKYKLLIFIISFQYGENFSIDSGAFLVMRRIPWVLQRWIVFINEDSHLLASLHECCSDNCVKAVCQLGCRLRSNAIFFLHIIKSNIEIWTQCVRFCSCSTHVESDNRSLHPLFLHIHDFQSLEEFLLS